MQIPTDLAQELAKLDASPRFGMIGATFERHAERQWEYLRDSMNNPILKEPALHEVIIIDNPTGEQYASATGPDGETALRAAIGKAHAADKPMTPAQKYAIGKASATVRTQLNEKDAEIQRLKEQLAKASGKAGSSKEKTTDQTPAQ